MSRCGYCTRNSGEKKLLTGTNFFPRGRCAHLVLRCGIPFGSISGSNDKRGVFCLFVWWDLGWLVGLGVFTAEELFLCLFYFKFKSMSPLMLSAAEREARTLTAAQAAKTAPRPQDISDSLHSCPPATPSGRVFLLELRLSSAGLEIAQAETPPAAKERAARPAHGVRPAGSREETRDSPSSQGARRGAERRDLTSVCCPFTKWTIEHALDCKVCSR